MHVSNDGNTTYVRYKLTELKIGKDNAKLGARDLNRTLSTKQNKTGGKKNQ